MRTLGILLCWTTTMSLSIAQYKTPEERYIEQYKDIAIYEMHRTGIPASIKLAQGLLESQAGFSELAQFANNHFGIKCKKEWQGQRFFKEDDDTDPNGVLIKSCFRVYPSALDSYKDHSHFLRLRPRYQKLFQLNRTDYRAWAYGLKECGYATDPNYPKKLIQLIEKYQLHQYDLSKPTHQSLAPPPPVTLPQNYKPGFFATE